jgi:hypothetical protein
MNDLIYQAEFVIQAVERILAQIDHDPLSPTYGCAHLAYWRDKTSDVADMRRQEVLFSLALLFDDNSPSERYKGDGRLITAIEALLSFWCRNQYADGSMDEWYKGERAFAAVAFSTFAVARTLLLLKGQLPQPLTARGLEKIRKTSDWLIRRDDLFKTNHQAVSVAALAFAGRLLEDEAVTERARKKLQSVFKVQTREHWFPEVGHMDIGYTFLTIEYVAMAMEFWGDWEGINHLARAFDFACEWIHPDLTLGSEYGVCQNTYISRIAIILMSRFSGRAAWLRSRIEEDGQTAYNPPTLLDDLRLFRYAFQPLLALEYARKIPLLPDQIPEILPLADSSGNPVLYGDASLFRFSGCGGTGIFSGASGGLIRLFAPKTGISLSDFGYVFKKGQAFLTNLTYNRRFIIQVLDQGWEITCPLSPVKKILPPFWARALLRMLCLTAIGSRLTRQAIDLLRNRLGTPINQSSANLVQKKTSVRFHRRLELLTDHLQVVDGIDFGKWVPSQDIFFLESVDDHWMQPIPLKDRFQDLPLLIRACKITKEYVFNREWTLNKIYFSPI